VTGYRAKSGALFLWVTELSSSNGMKLRGAWTDRHVWQVQHESGAAAVTGL